VHVLRLPLQCICGVRRMPRRGLPHASISREIGSSAVLRSSYWCRVDLPALKESICATRQLDKGVRFMTKAINVLTICVLIGCTALTSSATDGAQRGRFAQSDTASQSSSAAASTVGLCDAKTPVPPCIYQPVAAQRKIKGHGTKGDTVAARVNGIPVPGEPVLVQPDGTFTIPLAGPLVEYETVQVDENSPAIAGPSVWVKKKLSITCGPPPCIQQPYAGERWVRVKPKLTAKKAPASVTVTITPHPMNPANPAKIHKHAVVSSTPNPDDNTFTIPVSPALSLYDTLEVKQSDGSEGNTVVVEARPPICADPLPCIQQPRDTDMHVRGKAKPDPKTGKVAWGTQATVKVNGEVVGKPQTVSDDGTFSVLLETPLKINQTVQLSQTGPTVVGTVIAAMHSQICTVQAPVLPCLDQPHAGAKTVTGQASDKSSTIDIKVNGHDLGSAKVDSNGLFTRDVNTLGPYDEVEADEMNPMGTTGPVSVQAAQGSKLGMYWLPLAGVDITSSTTSGPQQQWFVDLRMSAPIGFNHRDPLEAPLWVWFNPRIASVPTPETSTLSSLSTAAATAFSASGAPTTLGAITQSLEFHGGLEVAAIKPREGVLYGNSALGLSLIAELGAVTPFSTSTGTEEYSLGVPGSLVPGVAAPNSNVTNLLQTFAGTPSLQSQYSQLYSILSNSCPLTGTVANKEASSCTYQAVAFVLPNRSRFDRSWSLGVRLRTFYFANGCTSAAISSEDQTLRCPAQDTFPGTMDITFGQDESVTAGRFYGFVLTLSASYPIPGASWLRVFGSAYLGLSKNVNSPALPITPSTNFVSLSSPSIILQPIEPVNQDYFRVGFGIDIAQVIRSWAGKLGIIPGPSKSGSSTTPGGAN
jgi:hypothetical protein